MITINFIEAGGKHHAVAAEPGWSLMEVATRQGVPGILGDCGGACACATCHVMIAQEWIERLTPKTEAEEEILGLAFDTNERSRLACQIAVDPALDGIVVELPLDQ